ncbi:MAG: hypothetical protein GVY19_06950 [Bacteroidetes bacterium]|nr:hypothetical protein [Bacteroidota bacterium]
MYKKIPYILLVILFAFSCKSGQESGGEFGEVPDSVLSEGLLEINEDVMQDIVQNISSPVEMAALLKSLGVPFSSEYLAPTDKVDNLTTSFKQAFNLGVYGADLGYLNMYNKTNAVLDYIQAIKVLSDAIRVGQFFDFNTLKRLATNNTNLDSLMYISVHSFNQMDKYLRSNKRSNLSTLILTGVWIEGLYLATQVAKEEDNADLKERIGEQKLILEKLIIVLENFSRDTNFANLVADFKDLQETFEPVEISYVKGEPEAIEEDGMLIIVQNEKSVVDISDDTLTEIIDKTEELRNKLISAI